MSLDCSGVVPERCVEDYVFPNKSKLASSKCKLVQVVLVLKDNLEDFRSSFYVTMLREEAIELSKLIEDKGTCLIVNEALNKSYTIMGFRYQQQDTYGVRPNVILRDGNLFFQQGNKNTHGLPEYRLICTNLYDEYGKLIEEDVFINYREFLNSVCNRCYLSYYKNGKNIKCYVDNKFISISDNSLSDYTLNFIPCTYYERGNVSVGEPIENKVVQLILNTGQTVEMVMLEENINYMASSVKPNEVITIDNLPVVVIGYTVMGKITELADCYYDETGLHLINKNYSYSTKYLYRVRLEQGITIGFSSGFKLKEPEVMLFNNKAVRVASMEMIGEAKFVDMGDTQSNKLIRRFHSVYMLKINLNGKIISVLISAIDYMLMQNSNYNYIVIDDNLEKIDSYIIDTKTTEGLEPNVALEVVGEYSTLRYFPESK